MGLFRKKIDRLDYMVERWWVDDIDDIQHFIETEMHKTYKIGSHYSRCVVAYLYYSKKYIIRIYFFDYPLYDLELNFDEFKGLARDKDRLCDIVDRICEDCNINYRTTRKKSFFEEYGFEEVE